MQSRVGVSGCTTGVSSTEHHNFKEREGVSQPYATRDRQMSQRESNQAKTLKWQSVKHDESKDNDKLKLTDATDSTHTALEQDKK